MPGSSTGYRHGGDLLLLHVVLLQLQLGLAHVVTKVHGPLLHWQLMQLLHLVGRQPPQCQLLQLLLILLLLRGALHFTEHRWVSLDTIQAVCVVSPVSCKPFSGVCVHTGGTMEDRGR